MNSINETVNKRRGRPALGNVLFAKRVSPAMAKELEDLVKKERGPRFMGEALAQSGAAYSKALGDKVKDIMTGDLKQTMEMAAIKTQLVKMTADYQFEYDRAEGLQLKLDLAGQDYDMAMSQTAEEKTKYWRDRAFRCESANKRNEFDQSQ
jgi:hypothetical protein